MINYKQAPAPNFIALARDVDRLFRARRKGLISPEMQESPAGSGLYRVNAVEQAVMRATIGEDGIMPNTHSECVSASFSSRTHVARLALLDLTYFASTIQALDKRESDRVKRVEHLITSYVSGLSRKCVRNGPDLIRRARKLGLARFEIHQLLNDEMAGRPLKVWPLATSKSFATSTDAEIKRTAAFLMRLHETLRVEAAEAEVRSAEKKARDAAEEEYRRAKAEAARIDAEYDEMVACGDDVLLAGMEW